MKKPRFHLFRPAIAAALAGVCALASALPVFAHELKDVSVANVGGQTVLRIVFAPSGSDGEYPLYFQKADISKGIVALSFLETETSFSLGHHELDAGSPFLEDVQIKKVTSPSGKNFLGLEFKLKTPPAGEMPVLPEPKGVLRINLGAAPKGKFAWSLAKSAKAKDDYLSAKAAPPPVAVKEPGAPSSAVAKGPNGPNGANNPKGPKTAPSEPAPEVTQQVRPSEVTEPSGPENAKPAEGRAKASPEGPEPVKSALEEGAALDAAHAGKGHGKGLSSSAVFTPGHGGKGMITLKDSIALRTKPGAKGKPAKKLGLGEKIEKLDGSGAWLHVAAGNDTGYVRADEAVYEDEMTPAQDKGVHAALDAKQAKLDAIAKKQEAAARKQEEAERKKAEVAAAKQEAAEKRKAELEAAQQAAAKEQENKIANAQPQTVATNAKAPKGKNALPSEPKQATGASAAGAPKLALADNPELADKLAKEKKAAEDEKVRVEPEENRIAYNSYGRRDPFIPVEQGAADNGIDIDQMKVVGIIWKGGEPMAVLEHTHEGGVSFTVKQGDPVHNGRVARITNDQVTFDISEYGIARSYSLKLVSSKEGAKK